MAFPAALIPILTGAGIGALTNPDDPLKGGLIGGAVGGAGAALPTLMGGGGLLAPQAAATGGVASQAGAAPIIEQGTQLGLPSVASEMAGTAGGVADLGQALQLEKAKAAQALLPQDKPGFTSQLTTGLLSNADKFVPDKQPVPTPQSGPSLRQQQAPAPQSLFMQFNRRRR